MNLGTWGRRGKPPIISYGGSAEPPTQLQSNQQVASSPFLAAPHPVFMLSASEPVDTAPVPRRVPPRGRSQTTLGDQNQKQRPKSMEFKLPEKGPEVKILRAKVNFSTQHIYFHAGDQIIFIQKDDKGSIQGKVNGCVGWFPESAVEDVNSGTLSSSYNPAALLPKQFKEMTIPKVNIPTDVKDLKLRTLFIPTVKSAPGGGLVQFGDYKDSDTVFGCPLSEIFKRTKDNGIPIVVSELIAYLENKGLQSQGIFRESGRQSEVEQLKKMYTLGAGTADLSGYDDPHTIAVALKQFFAQLPEPLIPFELYEEVIVFVESDNYQPSPNKCRTLLKKMEARKFSLLERLIRFLKLVSENSQHNKMGAHQLGVVFGPNLLRPKQETPTSMMSSAPTQIIEFLIQNYEAIFSP